MDSFITTSAKQMDSLIPASVPQRTKRDSMDSAIDTSSFVKDLERWDANNDVVTGQRNEADGSSYRDICDDKDGRPRSEKKTRWREKHKTLEDEEDLIVMVKNILLEQKMNDKNTIEQFRDEVEFLKNEILHKNNVITLLLDDKRTVKGSKEKVAENNITRENTSKLIAQKETLSKNFNHNANGLQNRYNSCIQPNDPYNFRTRSNSIKLSSDSELDCSYTSDEFPSLPSSLTNNDSVSSVSVRKKGSFRKLARITNSDSTVNMRNKGGVGKSGRSDSFGSVNVRSEESVKKSRRDVDISDTSLDFPLRYLQRTKSLPTSAGNSYRTRISLMHTRGGVTQNDTWEPNTVLVVGDCVLHGIVAKRLSKERTVKVRCFPQGTIQDFYHYLTPLLAKGPDKIIMHCGTTDATDKTSEQILDELLTLKDYIQKKIPHGTVLLSFPVIRNDNSKESYVIENLRRKLDLLHIDGIEHDNITEDDLGKNGARLNREGRNKLSMNFVRRIRRL